MVVDTSKEGTRDPVQPDELQLSRENVENDGEDMIEKELEYVNDKETGEVNEKESGKEAGVNENEARRGEKKMEIRRESIQRKRKQESKVDRALTTIVNAVTTAQKESDRMFIELEEKRMKLEEQLLMMEDRRMRDNKEREERMRRQERDFQLRMMMMLQQVPPTPLPIYGQPASSYTQSSPYGSSSSSPYLPSSPHATPPSYQEPTNHDA